MLKHFLHEVTTVPLKTKQHRLLAFITSGTWQVEPRYWLRNWVLLYPLLRLTLLQQCLEANAWRLSSAVVKSWILFAVNLQSHKMLSNSCCWNSVLGAFAKLRQATIRFVMSGSLSAWNNSAPTGRFFIKFDIRGFFENLSRKFKCQWNWTIIKGTLQKDQ